MKLRRTMTFLVLVVVLLGAGVGHAQTALPSPNAGFDITGFIHSATLNAAPQPGGDPALRGGTLVVNGRVITVPDGLIVQMPASSWTWPQLFDPTAWAPVYDNAINPKPPTLPAPPAGTTGLALTDPIINHYPSYEVRVVGNIVTDPASGNQNYVAGLIVPVTQQGLSNFSGYINFIDYATGRFRVGGRMGNATIGMLCEINDPVGRFGLAHSPDQRFTCDFTNPTVSTATGYPVGLPKVSPGAGNDPDRPYTNRPPNPAVGAPGHDPFLAAGAPMKIFTMPASAAPGTTTPDPYRQVPLMVGDWVDVSGTLYLIDPALPNTAANHYLSVHTLTAHLGVKTAPSSNPAYVRVEELLFGVGDSQGGPTVSAGNPVTPITQETSTRVALVMFTTDNMNLPIKSPYPARLLGIHVHPASGAETELQFPNGDGATNVDFQIDDPVRGRVRWTVSKNPATPVAGVLGNAVNPPGVTNFNFYREYIVKLNGARQVVLPNQVGLNGAVLPGLTAGQYRLPIFDYIFGEGLNFGEPWPPFNFHNFGFLTQGQGPTGPGGAVIGPLRPFPTFN